MARRQVQTTLIIIAVSFIVAFSFVYTFRNQSQGTRHPEYYVNSKLAQSKTTTASNDEVPIMPITELHLLHGEATAPKLENATLKAELGRSSWHLLHTMLAKFPDEPTEDDKASLKNYVYLFARLYPCGDCARHFQAILKQYPPQVSSRSAAATWGCHVHNEVNDSLGKDRFDCSKIGDFYDCGCAEDEDISKKMSERADGAEDSQDLKLQKEDGVVRGG